METWRGMVIIVNSREEYVMDASKMTVITLSFPHSIVQAESKIPSERNAMKRMYRRQQHHFTAAGINRISNKMWLAVVFSLQCIYCIMVFWFFSKVFSLYETAPKMPTIFFNINADSRKNFNKYLSDQRRFPRWYFNTKSSNLKEFESQLKLQFEESCTFHVRNA